MSSTINYEWDYSVEEFSMELDYFDEKEQEDRFWQAKTGLNLDSLKGAVEAIIFMSDRPISIQKIKKNIDDDLPLRVLHEAIHFLQDEYEQKHHGIRLQEVAEGYQFRTKQSYSKIIQKMFNVKGLHLTPSAMEVLAIIAYKQPVSKTSIEKLRGVDSSHLVRSLIDKRLVKFAGRSEDELGRPSLYMTTPEFLEVFNLNTVDELPSELELKELASNKIDVAHDIKNVVNEQVKTRFEHDELEELDQLSSSIKGIQDSTFFTSEILDEEKRKKKDQNYNKKSAFDLLEEFMAKDDVINANQEATQSESLQESEAKAINIQEAQLENLISRVYSSAFDEIETHQQKVQDEAEEEIENNLQELDEGLEDLDLDTTLEEDLELATETQVKEDSSEETRLSEEELLAQELDDVFASMKQDKPEDFFTDKEDKENADLIENQALEMEKLSQKIEDDLNDWN